MPETATGLSTQQALTQAQRRLKSLMWQLSKVQAENAPQVQEIANLQAAIADQQAAINSIVNA